MINPDASINRLDMTFGGKRVNVPWRGGQKNVNHGPAWRGVPLAKTAGEGPAFEGRSDGQVYSISYREEDGRLTIAAGIRNESDKAFVANPRARLTLGIYHEMKDPGAYFETFLPTLLRCEKTHFWGYFQNPNGQVLVIASPDPVASWKIGYIGF